MIINSQYCNDSDMQLCLHVCDMHVDGRCNVQACGQDRRGIEFRTEFSNLGQVRSLIPEKVCCMALTATATNQSRREIRRILGMYNPVIVSESPNKPNMKYIVVNGLLKKPSLSLLRIHA